MSEKPPLLGYTGPRVHHSERGGALGLFGQPRFPKALDHQFRVRLPAPGDPLRYCKGGIELKQTRHRLTRLSIASEMAQSGRETAVSHPIGGVLTKGLLRCDDGLVKARKLNKGIPHPNKNPVLQRVYRAHPNGTFKAKNRFL